MPPSSPIAIEERQDVPRLVENLGCLYTIEVPKVGCILHGPTLRCLQPKDKP
jgi:hypothetical protein